jgi:hemin uptake protein HemP
MATERDKPAPPAVDENATATGAAVQAGGVPRVVTSESLLGGASQLAILHDRTLYFLRQTRYGKLILTK